MPEAFQPAPGQGTRTNLAIEGLALSPAGDTLYAVNEEALEQDGPIATVDHGTIVRIVDYDMTTQTPSIRAQYAYVTEPIFTSPKDGAGDNGVSAMFYAKAIWPGYDLFVVERAFSSGVGNDVKIYGVRLRGADDVKDVVALSSPFTGKPASKTLLARFSSLPGASSFSLKPDNLEAITAGPKLSSGKQTLILASDNNFSTDQTNQFVAIEIVPPSQSGADPALCPACQPTK